MKIYVAKTIDINIDAVYNVESYKEIYADFGLMGFFGIFDAISQILQQFPA